MQVTRHSVLLTFLAVGSTSTVVQSQDTPADPTAHLMLRTGTVRLLTDTGPLEISEQVPQIFPPEGVETEGDSNAVLVIPDYDTVVSLAPESVLYLAERAGKDVGLQLRLIAGSASVVRASEASTWLGITVESQLAAVKAYAVIRGASVQVDCGAADVAITSTSGRVWTYRGAMPDRDLIGPDVAPVDAAAQLLTTDERVVFQPNQQLATSAADVAILAPWVADRVALLSDETTKRWVQRAFQGDITPEQTRGAQPKAIGTPPSYIPAFDQPTPAAVVQTPGPSTSVVRQSTDPAQALFASDTPGSVIAAQRFRLARIIGTSRSGALIVNRAAQPPLRLAR